MCIRCWSFTNPFFNHYKIGSSNLINSWQITLDVSIRWQVVQFSVQILFLSSHCTCFRSFSTIIIINNLYAFLIYLLSLSTLSSYTKQIRSPVPLLYWLTDWVSILVWDKFTSFLFTNKYPRSLTHSIVDHKICIKIFRVWNLTNYIQFQSALFSRKIFFATFVCHLKKVWTHLESHKT